MKQLSIKLLLSILLTSSLYAQNTNPLHTSVNADVNAMGSATATIAIYAPPGRKGITPSVAVSYNSNGGEGIMGMGWNLNSISSINVSGRNYHLDGVQETVTLTSADKFMLDGERLLLTSGTYGAVNSEYRTEHDRFVRVKYTGTSFIVDSKDGARLFYGNTSDSKSTPQGGASPIAWLLKRSYDINGNYVEYVYDNTNGQTLLTEIKYGGYDCSINATVSCGATQEATYNKITFEYVAAINNLQKYVAGFPVNQNKILSKIVSFAGTTKAREYVFTYTNDDVNTYLTQVQESNGANESLVPVTINWTADESIQRNNINVYTSLEYLRLTGDLDGDGKKDLIAIDGVLNPYENKILGKGNKLRAYRINPTGAPILLMQYNLPFDNITSVMVGDADADGDDDVVFQVLDNISQTSTYDDGGYICSEFTKYYLNQMTFKYHLVQSKFTTKLDYAVIENIYPQRVLANPQSLHVSSTDQFNKLLMIMPMLADVDGDGLLDLIERETQGKRDLKGSCNAASKTEVIPENRTAFHLYLSTRRFNSSIPSRYLDYGMLDNIDFYPMDFNGNGKLDFMFVKKNTDQTEIIETNSTLTGMQHIYGDGTLQFPTLYHKYIRLADFNGDSKTDLLYFVNNSWRIAYSTGQNFVEYNATNLWFLHNFNINYCGTYDHTAFSSLNFDLGDFNGDGKTDIIERHNHATTPADLHVGNSVNIYYSTGFGFNKQYLGTTNTTTNGNRYSDNYNLVSDFDGDGKADILQGANTIILMNQSYMLEKIPLKSKRVSLVQYTAVHSFGFEYDKLTNSTTYSKTVNPDKMSMAYAVSLPIYLVKKMSYKTTGFPDVTNEYFYKNLLYFTHGRGLMGFKETAIIKSLQTGKNNTVINNFEQNVELPYKLDLKIARAYNHCTDKLSPFSTVQDLISKTELDYSQVHTTLNKTVFSYNSYSTETNYQTGVVKITCAEYDINGNLIHSATTWGNTGNSAVLHTTSIDNLYGKYGTWLPASLIKSRTTNTHKNITQPHLDEVEYSYNAKGLVVAKERYKYSLHYYVKEITEYDKYGNVFSTALDSANNTTPNVFRKQTITYDNGKFPTVITNALGHTKQVSYELIYGNLTSTTDYDGQVITTLYNSWGVPYKTNYPGGNYKQSTNVLTNNTPTGTHSKVTSQTNLGEEAVTYLDARGLKIKQETKGFGGKIHLQEWVYDADGRLIKESNVYDAQQPSGVKWNWHQYDDYNRLIKTKYQNSIETYRVAYNGLVKTENYGLNKQKQTTLDAMGNVVQVTDNGGTITYKYGAHLKPIETASNGSVITINYNDQLNKIKLNDPNFGETLYDYNAFGELLAQKDANGNEFNFHYDDLGRVIKKFGMAKEYNYNYINSNGTAANGKLNYEELKVDGTITHKKEYEYYTTHGALKSVSEVVGNSINYNTGYLYDANLRLQSVSYPNIALSYSYGFGTDVIAITDGDNNLLWEKNSTTAAGVTNQFTYGNGFETTTSYNDDELLTSIESIKGTTTKALNVQYDFEYLTGNLNTRFFPDVNNHETFNYDNLDRLTEVTSSHLGNPAVVFDSKSYGYANNGNITSNSNGGLQEFTYHNNKLNAVTKHTFDETISPYRVPQGSLDDHNYTYNSIGKLALIVQANLEYKLHYGLDDERICAVKKENGLTTYTKRYINSASMEIKAGVELTYLYAEGEAFAIHKKTAEGQEIVYLHNDYQGSIMAITNQAGTIIETRSYDAWGRPRDPITWDYQLNPFSAVNITDRGYTFHEHLVEFSLINMNGRIYDPVMGRILSPDNYIQAPDNTQSFNRYSYCWNNPLKYTDPSGDFIFTAAVLIAAPFTAGASLALLPSAIGADIGAWQGGAMANGTANPFQWDYSSGKTWGYMGAGAAVGATSVAAASTVATSGMLGANTAAIFAGSFVNSVGTNIYTGGQTGVNFSLGMASYSSTSGWNGIWNWSKNSGLENFGYTLGALGNLGDIANVVDKFTHWEDKLAAKCKAYMDKWTSKNPNAKVDNASIKGNVNRSYPSYLGKNPRWWNPNLRGGAGWDDYMGMVDGWSWKEYAGYLHDAEYLGKGISVGAKYLLGSYKTMGADLRLMSRTLYLGLKHNSPFELLTGSLIGVINAQKTLYGWSIH
jgi:RHS repeat-associated protein